MLKIYDFHIDFQFQLKSNSQGTSRWAGSPRSWNGLSSLELEAGTNLTIPGTAFWVIAKGEIGWFLVLALLPYFGPPYYPRNVHSYPRNAELTVFKLLRESRKYCFLNFCTVFLTEMKLGKSRKGHCSSPLVG